MAAQQGGDLLLAYGPQGAQQLGSAVVLDTVAVVVSTRVVGSWRSPWTGAAPSAKTVRAAFAAAVELPVSTQSAWVVPDAEDGALRSAWIPSSRRDSRQRSPWGVYERLLAPENAASWGVAVPTDECRRAPWGQYEQRLQDARHASWGVAKPLDPRAALPWGMLTTADLDRRAAFAESRGVDARFVAPWTFFYKRLAPGWSVVVPIHDPNAPPEALYIVPVRRFYMTINSVELRKLDGNVELPAYSFAMSLDCDSWTWSFNASLRKDALPHVRRPAGADPVEIEATVNGVAYRLRIERVGREANFPATRIRVSGRGLAATLAAPYASVMTFGNPTAARTAQQLANDVLTINGVPLGWTVDWQLTDWLVPAGAWTFQGSYIEAINDIARAAGGYVQPHPTAATLRVLRRYPSAPWTWNTAAPDVELPAAAVELESTEWIDKPAYNRVFVGGVAQGVFGPVTRTGTAGDLVAPQVAHALVTAVEAHSQRGLAELADTGAQAHLQLKLPVLAESGLILPGQLVRYVGTETVTGIVRRTSLDGSTPIMRQTIGVETHVA